LDSVSLKMNVPCLTEKTTTTIRYKCIDPWIG